MLFIFILLLCTSIATGADKASSAKELTEEQLETAQLNGEKYFSTLLLYADNQKGLDAIVKNCEKVGINISTVKLYALKEANRHAIDKNYSRGFREKAAETAEAIFNSSEEFRKEAESAQIFPVKPTTDIGQFDKETSQHQQEHDYTGICTPKARIHNAILARLGRENS